MTKNDWQFNSFNGIGLGDGTSTLPVQTLPLSKKGKKWKKANMDALERIGIEQLHQNIKFVAYRKMINGEFTYSAVGIEEMELPWFQKEVTKLRSQQGIPTYLKHFDFIGIIVNVLQGLFSDFKDKYVIDSRDEYATNEFIRQKTERLHQYAQQVFMQEIRTILLKRGVDIYKQDFQTQEEQQAFQQQVQQQIQALTPQEIERDLAKNFKVIATEWAENTIEEDNKEFSIHEMDCENFVDYILSGRYFKHFGVGYDNYYVERWPIEETFFSQDLDARYPQRGEFAGRVTYMSPSNVLNRFGHLLTTKEQEAIGNYFNQSDYYGDGYGYGGVNLSEEAVIPETKVVPFHNYYDHQANVQFEDALGVPLAQTTFKDEEGEEHTFRRWMPRLDEDEDLIRGDLYSSYLRDDIEVRRDTIRVTEAYWRSYKRLGVLIRANSVGVPSIDLVTDDLLDEMLKDGEIKKLRTVTITELQKALRENRIYEYIDTITYLYTPEVWKGVKIRANADKLKEDLYLDVRPLDYQIRGSRSNLYDVLLPVAGIITTGLMNKLVPYQQLYNISMNQITDLLEKELGVFFAFDITAFPDEFREETTEESILKAREIIKDTGLLALDASRQNTQNNQPNIFQRHDVTYAGQVQYRWEMAQRYKAEALSQIGITPQMLGAPNTYTTAEGVKQGLQASYAILNPVFDKFNEAKCKEIELHIAIAQYCQSNGKDATVLFRQSDMNLRFLDIMAEDGDTFPLRHLEVTAETSSKDRKIIEQVKSLMMTDNTINRDIEDAINILTDDTIVELKDTAKYIMDKTNRKVQEDREFQSQQLQQNIAANKEEQDRERQHEVLLQEMNNQTKIEIEEIQAYATVSNRGENSQFVYDTIAKAAQDDINNNFRGEEIDVKKAEVARKTTNDANLNNERLQKLALKAQELRLKKEQIDAQKFTSVINKN